MIQNLFMLHYIFDYLLKDNINHSDYNDMLSKLNKEVNQYEKNYAMKHTDFSAKMNQSFPETSHDLLYTSIKSSKRDSLMT